MRADLYPDEVLAKCEALKASGLWAAETHIRPRAWLDNFKTAEDHLLGAILLDNLVFFANGASDRLLLAAFDRLEDDALQGRLALSGTPSEFLSSLLLTPIEGEDPRPTDSGKMLCRRLRDLAQIDDARFIDPPKALIAARSGSPMVFVDDFIGSGQQLIHTWQREYLSDGARSFEQAHRNKPFPAYCIALVATEQALRNIAAEGIPVVVRATHVLDESYSIQNLEAPTLAPPIPAFKDTLRSLLERHAALLARKEYFDDDAAILGFHELGLLLAFEHGIPDSTVPLLWADGGEHWVPLVRT